jgi:hypothetical protein
MSRCPRPSSARRCLLTVLGSPQLHRPARTLCTGTIPHPRSPQARASARVSAPSRVATSAGIATAPGILRFGEGAGSQVLGGEAPGPSRRVKPAGGQPAGPYLSYALPSALSRWRTAAACRS